MTHRTRMSRRRWLRLAGALGLVGATGGLAAACGAAAAKPVPMTVHKDPNCGCCTAWAKRMEATGDFAPRLVDEPDMGTVKARLRVPPELASCHTTEVAGYAIEGHVPAADIERLLAEKPAGVIGLAVPGMPAGSPGMEVLAFRADGRAFVFARHT
jgi:hypothetical protein